ncbi:MAG: peptide chain release factor 2 [Deltaproteobacteria bacterium]|nr:peptide chain release factor 2 [Deltaproteobacteria bacterium]
MANHSNSTIFEPAEIRSRLQEIKERTDLLRGYFDIPQREARLAELESITQAPEFWNDNQKASQLLKERSACEATLSDFGELNTLYEEAVATFELALEAKDDELAAESQAVVAKLAKKLHNLEFQCKMSQEFDRQDAIVEINGGSGGTEAQDWAAMLLRMYIRWAERKGFKVEELDYQPGEVAGIKSATIFVQGDYSYGHLRSEHGVHRLVRISPFDSNARRHTSFASVSITPDIEEEIEIEIDDKDLRIDTYRSSGAGGQHVNKTDSAVRITHLPTGIVVACQNERSQHKNRDRAMKILKAKLYELEQQQQQERLKEVKGQRKSIDFGSQIRSYVMQPYQMVKDHRTSCETSAVDKVLDGEIDGFIEAYLLAQ